MPLPPRRTAKQRLVLAIVATDATFERVEIPAPRGRQEAWGGKCLHCNRALLVSLEGNPISRATIEHIVPQHHGGTDEVTNVALACAGCNSEKGRRHDHKHRSDARLQEIIAKLTAKRHARWRAPT